MPRSDQDNGSIFDGLNENAVTIVFRNLLDRYISVRQALQRTLPEDVQEAVDLSNINPVETHPSGGSGKGIPDLIIRGHGFVLVIEIKVKQKRGLTPEQENAYKSWTEEAIQDEQTGFVTFLIPADYHHREELKAQADEDDRSGRVRILPPVTWNQLLEKLGPLEELADELIREFYDHLSERFIPKPVIFSIEEISLMHSEETASGIFKLMDLVEKIKAKLESEFRTTKPKYYNYGYYVSPPRNNKLVYFGIWPSFWAEHGFPLCVAIQIDHEGNQSIQVTFRERNRVLLFEEDERYLVSGYKPEPCTDCSKLIGDIVTDIETLLRKDGSEESSEDAETP